MSRHRLAPHRETLHGTFSADWPPVMTIAPGDTVVVTALDAGWANGGDLAGATLVARDGMLDLLAREACISRHRAMAPANVLVDVRVTPIADGPRGVHATMRHGALTRNAGSTDG